MAMSMKTRMKKFAAQERARIAALPEAERLAVEARMEAARVREIERLMGTAPATVGRISHDQAAIDAEDCGHYGR